jgi:predicted GNAT family acetyltransferase
MTEPTGPVVVRDNPDEQRYELMLGDTLAGFVSYRLRGDRLVLTHTEVVRELQGRGWGSRLVGEALADAGARGLTVMPLCPFVVAYIRKHPELRELVA